MLKTGFHTLQKLYDVNIIQFLLTIHITTHLTNMKAKKLIYKKKFNKEIMRLNSYIGSTNKTKFDWYYGAYSIIITRHNYKTTVFYEKYQIKK